MRKLKIALVAATVLGGAGLVAPAASAIPVSGWQTQPSPADVQNVAGCAAPSPLVAPKLLGLRPRRWWAPLGWPAPLVAGAVGLTGGKIGPPVAFGVVAMSGRQRRSLSYEGGCSLHRGRLKRLGCQTRPGAAPP
jgi:hypothetical protein